MRLLLSGYLLRPRKQICIRAMAQHRSSSVTGAAKPQNPPVPRPSASVQTSSAFPSAYVFPGGNLSANQDGEIPDVESSLRHIDSEVYRRAAIRETFEECGILLVKRHKDDKHLIQVRDSKRERIRKAVHSNEKNFFEWVHEIGAEPDTDGLLPFTRWVTPIGVPKRFTTQMYVYFLPLNGDVDEIAATGSNIPVPSSDGGLEHTAAEFDHVSNWLSLANPKVYPRASGEGTKDIIMFPPQFFLLHLLAPLLPKPKASPFSRDELLKQRDNVLAFLKTGEPTWGEKCISPIPLGVAEDGRRILSLEYAGSSELVSKGRKGEHDRIVLTRFLKAGPAEVEVRWRHELDGILKSKASSNSRL